jgi:hypothetical protein
MGQYTTIHIVLSVCVKWKWENAEIIQKLYNITSEYEGNYNSMETISIKVQKCEGSVKDIDEFGKSEELIKCISNCNKEHWDKINKKYGDIDMYVIYDCDRQYDGRLSSSNERDKCVMGNFNHTPKEFVKHIKKGKEFFKSLGFEKKEIRLSYVVNDLW